MFTELADAEFRYEQIEFELKLKFNRKWDQSVVSCSIDIRWMLASISPSIWIDTNDAFVLLFIPQHMNRMN